VNNLWLKSWIGVPDDVRSLFDTRAVREAAGRTFESAQAGKTNFELHLDKLPEVAKQVAASTRKRYPDLKVPPHSRWGHFRAGGRDRVHRLENRLAALTPRERLRSELDLAVVSVLLDAGAGMQWFYTENTDSHPHAHGIRGSSLFRIGRSEGLALASLAAFEAGKFSSDATRPYQVDGMRLSRITAEDLSQIFQVTPTNPILGLEGRAALLRRLGERLLQPHLQEARVFIHSRPSDLLWVWEDEAQSALEAGQRKKYGISANTILQTLLLALGPIWQDRPHLNKFCLGDCWPHPDLGWVPFHKLSQWLTYSLLDPLEKALIPVLEIERLTGLPEYRNGGLFLDSGVLSFRREALAEFGSPEARLGFAQGLPAWHPLVIEWRALTVALLDRIAPLVRQELGVTEANFSQAKVLEGGTWWAGRELAASLRQDGGPPFRVLSDGTVF
jgi:hypothetical protein